MLKYDAFQMNLGSSCDSSPYEADASESKLEREKLRWKMNRTSK